MKHSLKLFIRKLVIKDKKLWTLAGDIADDNFPMQEQAKVTDLEVLQLVVKDKELWTLAGDIAERFHKKDTAKYDDLQDKLFYWIKCGLLQ